MAASFSFPPEVFSMQLQMQIAVI